MSTFDVGGWDVLLRHADGGAADGPSPGGGERGRRRCTGLQHYFWPTPRRPPAATPPPVVAPPTPVSAPRQPERPRFRGHAMSKFSFYSVISFSSPPGKPRHSPESHTYPYTKAPRLGAPVDGEGSARRNFSKGNRGGDFNADIFVGGVMMWR